MKSIFFDENGYLNIDQAIAERPSFKKIMDDGIVTESELDSQSKTVIDLLNRIDQMKLDDTQKSIIRDLLVESNVLSAIFQYYQLQNLK